MDRDEPDQEQLKILIVEDESIVALDMENRLASLGYRIVGIASTGARAMELAAAQGPDLVLMDIKLKGDLDGIDTAELILRRLDIPIIFITAFADEATLARAKVTDAFAYILKPFNEREVVIAIQISLYKHRMESELRRNRALLDGILNTIGDGVVATDEGGGILFLNSSARAMLGAGGTAEGRTISDYAEVRDGPGSYARLESRGGNVTPVEYARRSLSLGVSGGGAALHVFRDVTERLQAAETESRFASIARHTADAVYTVDGGLRIRSWNRGAERMYGWTEAEALGAPLASFRAEGSPAPDPGPLLSGGVESLTFECEARRKDGSSFAASVSMSAVSIPGWEADELFVIERDVSAQKEYERSLERAKLLAEETARAKGEFLSNVSHELRTPLNSIMGMTELSLDLAEKPDQREFLQIVLQSAASLLTLINSILDFSKIEAGRMQLHPAPFSVTEAMETCAEGLMVQAQKKGLALITELDPACPDGIVGDQFRLQQVLINLLNNAVKFTEAGSVSLRARRDGERIAFEVEDTGIGIPLDKHATIFEKFLQLDGSTKRAFGGTGLGLSIVKGLAELMDGKVEVESERGEGSLFRVSFPLREDRSADARRPLAGALRGVACVLAGIRPAEAAATGAKLSFLGASVESAASVADGIARLSFLTAGGARALLLIDDLAEDSGELLSYLRSGPEAEAAARRVVVMTAVNSKAEVAWKTLFEGLRFVVKPPKLRSLAELGASAEGAARRAAPPAEPRRQEPERACSIGLDAAEASSEAVRGALARLRAEAESLEPAGDWERLEAAAERARRDAGSSGANRVEKFLFSVILSLRKGDRPRVALHLETLRRFLDAASEGGP